MIKDFIQSLYLTKREKRGYGALILLILFVIAFQYFVLPFFQKPPKVLSEENLKKLDVIQTRVNEKQNLKINPNQTNYKQLIDIGVSGFVANNWMKYLASGGSFNHPKDLLKVYGLTDSLFQSIQQHLIFDTISLVENIDSTDQEFIASNNFNQENDSFEKEYVNKKGKEISISQTTIKIDNSSFNQLVDFGFSKFVAGNILRYIEKGGSINNIKDLKSIYGIDTLFVNLNRNKIIFPEAIVSTISLNSCDSLKLMSIKGIGKVYASRIISYREKIGGFYSLDQLNEIYGLEDFNFYESKIHFKIDSSLIQKINIHQVEFKTLLKHPYFEYADVKIIFDLKERNDNFSVQQIINHPLINPKYKKHYTYYLKN